MKTVRHIELTNDLATFMSKACEANRTEAYLYEDWEQSDDIDRKQAPSGYLMVDGCRPHRAACLQLQTQRSPEFE